MKTKFFLLGIIVLIVYTFLFQGQRGIYESTEGRYANVAYTMLKGNDWMHPKLHFEQPHWTKPPMYYWVTALSLEMFGKNAFAVRFPGALAFLLTILAIFMMGKIFVPHKPWLASIIYASFLLPVAASNAVSTDGLLTFFETAGMACIAFSLFDTGRKRRGFYLALAAGGFYGAAFLTKGPPALLPLLGIGLLLLFHRDLRKMVRISNLLLGILVFLIVGGSWFYYVIWETPNLLAYFWTDEILHRIATGQHHRNSGFFGGFFVYLPTLLIGSLPWTLLAFRGVRKKTKQITFDGKLERKPSHLKDQFLLFWFFVPLTIFLIVPSRLPLYILPLFAPLAFLCARVISSEFLSRRSIIYLLTSWALLIITLRLASGFLTVPQDSKILAQKIKTLCPKGFSEIVFVDSKPHYGLSLYLDVPIERVTFLLEYQSYPKVETLGEEIKIPEPNRIWMVPPDINKQFRDFVQQQNIQANLINWVDGRATYGVYRLSQ